MARLKIKYVVPNGTSLFFIYWLPKCCPYGTSHSKIVSLLFKSPV